MTLRQPPCLATKLLERMAPPLNDALVGDLVQEYCAGRSVMWYWRQVIFAVVVTSFHEITSNKAQSFRAVMVGWACSLLCWRFLTSPLANLDEWLYVRGIADVRWWFPDGTTALVFVLILEGVVTGWVVTRFYRPSMLLMFVLSVVMFMAWLDLSQFLIEPRPPHVARFMFFDIIRQLCSLTSILVGGIVGTSIFSRRRIVV